MKRWLIGCLMCMLLFPISAATAEEQDYYWWDVGDTEITTVSSGTGGTRGEHARVQARQNKNLDPEVLVAKIKPDGVADDPEVSYVDDALIQVLLSDYEKSEEPYAIGKLHIRTGVFKADSFDMLELSDLFYDDVNYIHYINDRAQTALYVDKWNGNYFAAREGMLRRPFSGFPCDYPYFRIVDDEMGGRMLELLIDCNNPLFAISNTSSYTAVRVPLPDTLSPYGKPWVDIWTEEYEPDIHCARASFIDAQKQEAIAYKVNAAFEEAARRALMHPLMQKNENAQLPLVPHVSYDESYIKIAYYGTENYKSGDQTTLVMMMIDMHTGEVVNGDEIWQTGLELIRIKNERQLIFDQLYEMESLQEADVLQIMDILYGHFYFLREELYEVYADFRRGHYSNGFDIPELDGLFYVGCGIGIDKYDDNHKAYYVTYFDPKNNVEYSISYCEELRKLIQ